MSNSCTFYAHFVHSRSMGIFMDSQKGTRLLYSCLNMRKQLNQLLKNGNLSQGEYHVLRCTRRQYAGNGSQHVKAADLSEILGLSRPSITRILNTLEKRDYISRTIDKNDRRSISIELTGNGLEALEKANKALLDISNKLAYSLGQADTDKLIELVDRLAEIYKSMLNDNGDDYNE